MSEREGKRSQDDTSTYISPTIIGAASRSHTRPACGRTTARSRTTAPTMTGSIERGLYWRTNLTSTRHSHGWRSRSFLGHPRYSLAAPRDSSASTQGGGPPVHLIFSLALHRRMPIKGRSESASSRHCNTSPSTHNFLPYFRPRHNQRHESPRSWVSLAAPTSRNIHVGLMPPPEPQAL